MYTDLHLRRSAILIHAARVAYAPQKVEYEVYAPGQKPNADRIAYDVSSFYRIVSVAASGASRLSLRRLPALPVRAYFGPLCVLNPALTPLRLSCLMSRIALESFSLLLSRLIITLGLEDPCSFWVLRWRRANVRHTRYCPSVPSAALAAPTAKCLALFLTFMRALLRVSGIPSGRGRDLPVNGSHTGGMDRVLGQHALTTPHVLLYSCDCVLRCSQQSSFFRPHINP